MWPKGVGFRVLQEIISFFIKPMNYLIIYLKFIDQIIEYHDKRRDPMPKVLKSCVPKVVP